jgi:hypothetical protein
MVDRFLIQLALKEVDNKKMSLRAAAKFFNIPRATLQLQ